MIFLEVPLQDQKTGNSAKLTSNWKYPYKIPEIEAVEQIADTETGLELNAENVDKVRNQKLRIAQVLVGLEEKIVVLPVRYSTVLVDLELVKVKLYALNH